jgi:16S rRNA (cytosine967-C5)-methyltransferase
VLDVCAAPGGKSLHMAGELEAMGKGGSVEARDLSKEKVDRILENIQRSGLSNVDAKAFDATVLDEDAKEAYDVVICDLPCSGLGVLGKKPEIKYRVLPEDISSLAELQRSILKNAATYVRPGGKLLYSTCTINKEENEDNARWFLDTFDDYDLESMEQIFPKTQESDGFFIALFKRN